MMNLVLAQQHDYSSVVDLEDEVVGTSIERFVPFMKQV